MEQRHIPHELAEQRHHMVSEHLARRGIKAPLVLKAMGAVPREAFISEHLRQCAYTDTPLVIGDGQTISQPYIVALMVQALGLTGGDRVLEIGTGSGYAAAILAEIAAQVFTVERIATLAKKAAATLTELGCENVHVLTADGSLGWPEHAPYDAIIVAAGGPVAPETLKQQLVIGGRLVMPIGQDEHDQELVRVTRVSADAFTTERLGAVRFVPLIGAKAWNGQKRELPLRKRAAARILTKR
jgi:protein-L-isoaspartate(D-aspartate) O-methyltransferase